MFSGRYPINKVSADAGDPVSSATSSTAWRHNNSSGVLGSVILATVASMVRIRAAHDVRASWRPANCTLAAQIHHSCLCRLAAHHGINPFGPPLQRAPLLDDVFGFVVGPGDATLVSDMRQTTLDN